MQRRVSSHFDLKPVRPSPDGDQWEFRKRGGVQQWHAQLSVVKFSWPDSYTRDRRAELLQLISRLLKKSRGSEIVRVEGDLSEFEARRVAGRKWKTTFPSHGNGIELIILCTHHRGRQLEIAQYEICTLMWCPMEGPEEQEWFLLES